MALKWCNGQVVKKQIWTDGLFTLAVKVDGVQEFLPGQFLQLGYQNGDEHIHRPYSVASPWSETLEFFIVRVDDGELTPWLWNLNEGDTLHVNHRAAGSFTLKKTPDAKVLWLIATGTGLAPYIAMLRTTEPWTRFEKIVLVHGARVPEDLAYAEELTNITSQHPDQFSYVPTLTRADAEGALRGRIPQLLESGALENAANSQMNAENSAVMLCGNPAMLDSMETYLETRSMKKHRSKSPGHIVLERYW